MRTVVPLMMDDDGRGRAWLEARLQADEDAVLLAEDANRLGACIADLRDEVALAAPLCSADGRPEPGVEQAADDLVELAERLDLIRGDV